MLFERLPEVGCDLGLSWAKERWVLGAGCHPGGRVGQHHAWLESREEMGMLVTSSW